MNTTSPLARVGLVGRFGLIVAACSLALLGACAKNEGSAARDEAAGSTTNSASGSTARGSVLSASLVGSATTTTIDSGTSTSGIQTLTGTAKCGVNVYYMVYSTQAPDGNAATATAGIFLPSGTDSSCTGSRPVLLYGHGTATTATTNSTTELSADGLMTNMAQASDSTSTTTGIKTTKNSEAASVLAFFAAQGYIVVLPNYLGYDRSSLSYHPYLVAKTQANEMIDAWRAAKTYIATLGSVTP